MRADMGCTPPRRTQHGAAATLMPDLVPFDDLELGPLLGRGSFGRVYRGLWEGKPVAVKACHPPSSRKPTPA